MITPILKREIIRYLKNKFGTDLLSIYGIGSAFVSEITYNDVDIVVILSKLDKCIKYKWTSSRFERIKLMGADMWFLYGTLEGYMDEKTFKTQSFANWAWSVRGLKYASELLYGTDIRNRLPEPNYDYEDILLRIAYHLEPSPEWKIRKKEKIGDPIDERIRFTKGVFKFGFFIIATIYPESNVFDKVGIYDLLCKAYDEEIISGTILDFYEIALDYRKGKNIENFKDTRDSFIRMIVHETIFLRNKSWQDIKRLFQQGFSYPFSYIIRHIDREGWED